MASDADLRPEPPVTGGWWDRFESGPVLTLASLLFVGSTLVMLSEGLNRSIRDVSFFWAEESVRYLMIWAFFLTLGIAGRRGLHIRTEMLVSAVSPRLRRAMNFVAVLAGLVFAAVLFGASLPQLVRYYTMGMMSESSLDIPQWVIFCAMPVGAMLWFGYYLRCLLVWWHDGDPFAVGGVTGSEL
ncbi:MAG: TRAP transporter small permease subunit [Rubrivivax sp.]|nr:TRAP transporter small permease subunit [Rubrivivax sp.]